MNVDDRLQQALDKLAKGGRKIGQPTELGGEMVIPVNGVLLTPAKIFTAAEMDPHPKS